MTQFDPRERDSILRDVVHDDDEMRRLAVERIAMLPPEEAIAHLIDRLGDPSWRVRKAAVDRLADSGSPALATQLLVRALADGDNPGRRNAALEALVRCGPQAVPSLLEATASDDVDVRKQVVDALAGIGDRQASPRLAALLADADANVRGAAADALGAIGDPSGAAPLLAAAGSDDERLVALSALRALARMEHPVLVSELRGLLADALLRPAVLSLLAHSADPEAREALLRGLVSTSRASREAAMGSMLQHLACGDDPTLAARVGEVCTGAGKVIDDATRRLESAELPMRLMLVQFLGVLRAPESVVPLLRAASDEALSEVVLVALEGFGATAADALAESFERLGADERVLACEVLGRIPGDVGSALLVASLSQSDSEVRIAAARALGARGCREALAPLVDHLERVATLEDELDEHEARWVADAIAAIASSAESGGVDAPIARDAAALLTERLPSAGEAFRRAAAHVLGRIGSSNDADALALLMADPDAAVRRAAVEALARLQGAELPEPLHLALADEAATVRIAAAAALAASVDPRSLDDLERLGQDEDPYVRAAVMRAAGAKRLPEPGAGEWAARRLVLLRAGAHDQALVAVAALEALLVVGGEGAALAAAELLRRPEVELARAAIACVGTHGDVEAQKELFPLIAHADWSVRAEAVRVLAERRVSHAVPAILRRLETEQDEFVRDSILQALAVLEH